MQEQFVTFEIALALERAGFKERCFTSYTNKGLLNNIYNLDLDALEELSNYRLLNELEDSAYCINGALNSNYIAAPLWQQAVDWLREVHEVHTNVYTNEVHKPNQAGFIAVPEEGPMVMYFNGLSGFYEARKDVIADALRILNNIKAVERGEDIE